MYIFVSPEDLSSNVYNKRYQITNTISDFTLILPKELSLPGAWDISILELSLHGTLTRDIYIHCNIIEWSLLNSEWKPILWAFRQSLETSEHRFLKVIPSSIQRISFSIRDSVDNKVSLTGLSFILNLRQRNNESGSIHI